MPKYVLSHIWVYDTLREELSEPRADRHFQEESARAKAEAYPHLIFFFDEKEFENQQFAYPGDDPRANIVTAIEWLNENSFNWMLEVNPHNGNYESMESYLAFRNLDAGDIVGTNKDVSTWKHMYDVQVYPCTANTCYILIGSDLLEVLGKAMLVTERHGNWKTAGERTGADFEGGPYLRKHKEKS